MRPGEVTVEARTCDECERMALHATITWHRTVTPGGVVWVGDWLCPSCSAFNVIEEEEDGGGDGDHPAH